MCSHQGMFESAPVRGIPKSSDQHTSARQNTLMVLQTHLYATVSGKPMCDCIKLRELPANRFGRVTDAAAWKHGYIDSCVEITDCSGSGGLD